MQQVLLKAIEVATQKYGASYAEARAQKLCKTMFTLEEERVETTKQGIESGVALRVLVNGAWGFVSIGSFEDDILFTAASNACIMAKIASQQLKNPIKLASAKVITDCIKVKPKKNPADIALEDKIQNFLQINKTIQQYDQRIKSCTVDYLDLAGSSFFVNSEGTDIQQDKMFVWSKITASAKNCGVFTFSSEEIGAISGYEVFDTQFPQDVGETVARRAVAQLVAKTPKGGKAPVVLGPSVVGVFVHEAFGHLAEADLALSGGVLFNALGKKIGSDLVTVYDDGTIPGAFGSFKYDDEGVPVEKTLLIKDGVVMGLMHNRETACKLDTQSTGNARAEDFRVEPIIRMRNTYMAPRDYEVKELLEGVKSGYFFKSFRGGQANIDGTFQVGIQDGYEIVNGEIGAPVRNASISGNTLEILLKVNAVGKDFALDSGRCGKGQTAFIGDGGPHIRLSEVVVGGSV